MMAVEPIAENVQRVTNAIATLSVPKLDASRTAREVFNAAQMGVVAYAAPALWEKPVHQQDSVSPMDALLLVRASNVVPMGVETSVEPVREMSLAVQTASALPCASLLASASPAEMTAVEGPVGAALASKYARRGYASLNALQIVGGNNVEMTAAGDSAAHVQEANCARTESAEMRVRPIVWPNNVEMMGVVVAAEYAPRERPARSMGYVPNRVKRAEQKAVAEG